MSNIKKGVRLENVSKIYLDPKTNKPFKAVDSINVNIKPGDFVTLLGPSGCGKTTTLRMIAGFESPDEGEIYLGDQAINELTPNKRDTAMVFQSYALFPHMNIFDNVAYGLKLRKVPKAEIRRIQQEVGITAIYVTHDQSEAMALSDEIIVMDKGVVAQMGTPRDIYYRPVSEFVADFIGEANFLRGELLRRENGGVAVLAVDGQEVRVEDREGLRLGERYTAVLRPEAARLSDEGGVPCRVVLSCFMGSYQNYHVMLGNTLVKLEDHNPKNKRIYQAGEMCQLVFDAGSVHVL